MEVVGEASDEDALHALMADTEPDLVLLDWQLTSRSSGALLAALKARHPGLKVIVLSGQPGSRRAALGAGADAFVSKGEPPERLLAALRAVAA